jgi:Ca2+/H+ antiporter
MLLIALLVYYSIAAQSSFVLGAVLNATFGSVVEIILYVSVMIKGKNSSKAGCYIELVKSALTGLTDNSVMRI